MISLVLHDHYTVHQNDRQIRHRHDDLPQVPTCCSCHIMGYSYVYPPLSKNSDRLDGHSGGSFYVYDFVKYSWENKYFRNLIPSHYISWYPENIQVRARLPRATNHHWPYLDLPRHNHDRQGVFFSTFCRSCDILFCVFTCEKCKLNPGNQQDPPLQLDPL